MVAIKTQVSIIQSTNIAERVVGKLDLANAQNLVDVLTKPSFIQHWLGYVSDWFRYVSEYIFGKPPPPIPLTPEDRVKTIASILLGKMTASNDGKSYLIEIAAQSENGALSAKIANAFADSYLNFNRRLKIDSIKEANTRFFDQLPPLAEKVRDADKAVQTFRAAHELTPAAGPGAGRNMTLADQQLAQVNVQLGEAINDRTEKEARLKQMTDALHGKGQLDAVPEIVGSQHIQALRQQQSTLRSNEASLGASALQANPNLMAIRAAEGNVNNTIMAEVMKIAASQTAMVRAARDREAALQDRLAALRDVVATQSVAEIQLRDLENQADAAREVYTSYLHRFQQTASLGLMQQPDAELISQADIPLHPTGPRRMQILVLASIVSIVIAVLCALLAERFRGGFFTPIDLEAGTGLTVIGLIPRLRRSSEMLSSKATRIQFREAINQVRAALEFGGEQYRARVVLVTSALQGEGKTHFANSLARSVALRGGRALLINCASVTGSQQLPDKRHNLPVVTEAAETQSSNNLIITPGAVPGLDVGILRPNGDDSFARPSLNRARAEVLAARETYDLIVLDGPSVPACAEAELFCGVIDGVIMTVRWGRTTKGDIFSAMRILRVYGVHPLGAVLTNVDIKQLTKSSSRHGDLYRYYADH